MLKATSRGGFTLYLKKWPSCILKPKALKSQDLRCRCSENACRITSASTQIEKMGLCIEMPKFISVVKKYVSGSVYLGLDLVLEMNIHTLCLLWLMTSYVPPILHKHM